MSAKPLILYVPGLKPKPEPAAHREQLFRCLLEGVRRIDSKTADALAGHNDAFDIVSWTFDFYGEHRDISVDIADIDSLLTRNAASESDKAIANSWKRRLLRWLFRTADFLPFTIPKLATEELEVHLRDLNHYVRNKNGAADAAREKLKIVLKSAAAADRPLLLIAHSMGSVIAMEALWEISQDKDSEVQIDLLLTMGSPLGQKLIQRRLLPVRRRATPPYPANIRNWINIAAVGELTAIDMTLRDDFAAMIELGLVTDIEDRQVYNYYHMHGTLNVHAEYGYLVNEVTASIVRDWWNGQIKPFRASV
jgi:pimeloyl-ACP methyl ester carboxylesterase